MKRLICGAASDELIREAAADQPPSLFRSPSGAAPSSIPQDGWKHKSSSMPRVTFIIFNGRERERESVQ